MCYFLTIFLKTYYLTNFAQKPNTTFWCFHFLENEYNDIFVKNQICGFHNADLSHQKTLSLSPTIVFENYKVKKKKQKLE